MIERAAAGEASVSGAGAAPGRNGAEPDAVLDVRHLTVDFHGEGGPVRAVDDVSFTRAAGARSSASSASPARASRSPRRRCCA